MYNDYQTLPYETDECLSRGICSVNSTLTSIQEIILLYIKEMAFYLLKLKDFGITNEEIKSTIIYALFNLVTGTEYNQEQFHETISKLYSNISQSKVLYENFCKEKKVDIQSVKTYFKHSKNFNLTDAIKKGERYFLKKSSNFTSRQKDLFDITLFLVKSAAVKMFEAQRLGADYDDEYYATLSMMNSMNFNEFSEEKAQEEIKKYIYAYYKIVRDVFYAQVKLYGDVTPVEVSFSTVPGKAILVSGSDYKKLENVLKATEGTEISVYTHGMEMLMAHSLPKMRSHPNLRGHFGTSMDSSVADFSTFPGAILMTKGTLQKIEYLYRGRLFTLDPIPPMGVIKIKDDNYEPLIKSAFDAKGFSKATLKPSAKVGFSEEEINKKVDEIMDKVINNEIRHLYIIGMLNFPNVHSQYFDKFFELMPKDCYAISLSHKKSGANIFYLDFLSDYWLIYKILKRINEKIPFNKIDMTIFLTRCDKHTIANLLYLKEVGVKNVYMCKCPPSLVNPALIKTLQEIYGIKEFSDPQKDIEDTLIKKD
ncbi:MAG: hypothetical protein WCY19_04460 [Candidatus Gastranaerophilaceae bacterium]